MMEVKSNRCCKIRDCKIYHGPYIYNFREIYNFLEKNNISKQVNNYLELSENLVNDLENPKKRE